MVDEERSFKCNACGKGFARIDVLKKHEAVACKMLRSAPSTSGEQSLSRPSPPAHTQTPPFQTRQPPQSDTRARGGTDFPMSRASGSMSVPRIAPRGQDVAHRASLNRHAEGIDKPSLWRKRQRRNSDGSEVSGSSHEDDGEPSFERRYNAPTYPQPQPGSQHTTPYHPQRYPPPHHLDIGPTSVHSTPHLPPLATASTSYSMPLISPTQPRDMSISLAPAYALTPDVSGIGPDPDRPLLKIETEQPGPSMTNGSTSALEPLSADLEHRYEAEQSVGAGGFEMPAKVGENMDDLLSWLFNTNAPGTGGDWGFGVQQSQTQQEMLPTFSAELVAQESEQASDTYPSYYPADAPTGALGYGNTQSFPTQKQYSWGGHDGHESARGVNSHLSTSESGPSGAQSQSTQRRYPQPLHPLYIPNIPGKTNIPTFNGSGNERASIQGRERYKEVIDDEVKDAMLDMFEVSPWNARLAVVGIGG